MAEILWLRDIFESMSPYTNRKSFRNEYPNARDHWGESVNGIQIDLWPSHSTIDIKRDVDLLAAVRNVSDHELQLGNCFGLDIQGKRQYFEGPRSTTPIVLQSREVKEIASRRVEEDILSKVGTYGMPCDILSVKG
jgi:hypothetical protein